MSKLKKVILSIIITLLGIIGISTVSSAYYVGQNITVRYSEYLSNPNIYCVEHGQALRTINYYKIISQVNIRGKTSTDHTGKQITHNDNAKLAYILSGDNGPNKGSGPVSNAVWNFIHTWMNDVGQYHAGLYKGFTNGVTGSSSPLDTESSNYANTVGDLKITDNTNKDNISVKTYNRDGREYIRIGPFNWSFSGTITGVSALDQNGQNIDGLIYSSFNGNNEYWYEVGDIKSGRDFYVSVPADTGVTKVTKITAKAKLDVKGVNIWFLESTTGYKQNLIIREPYTATEEIETPFEYNIVLRIKLSGYVWVDKQDQKQWIRNDLYHDDDFDTNDILLDGVTVRLKDRTTGETVKETTTSDGGAYMFDNVLVEKIGDYYIEFEYDGLTYTNVTPHLDKDNGSKSAENATVRDEFNKNFSTVEGRTQNSGYTRDASGNEKHQLSYNFDPIEHKSTLINNGQYLITANTDVANYILGNYYVKGQEEMKFINLGLYEREQPDMAIAKDIENVRVAVNGYEHTYEYAQRFNHPENYGGEGFNVGVKFGEKYSAEPYKRAIYEADYEYINENDKSKELKVYITYKIAMSNQSTNLIAQINSIVDYYDSRYSIVGIGTGVDEAGNITGNLEYQDGTYNDNYKKVIINNNTRIDPLTSTIENGSVYVQFELNREAVINILNGKENLDNVVEINSYSIFDQSGKVYAGIDVDSNPGTCNPEDKATYEDDTDASLSLQLEVADSREMAGKVFLDSTSGELMTGQIRQGSGIYEDGELGIEGVDITLTENTGSGKVYTAKTDSNGDFYISGYIPGDYTLTYTWGDQTYTVQNYKGTVYNTERDQNNKQWFKEDVDTRYTDALDDYELRRQIDEEIKHIENSTTTTIDKMNSTTPTMGIGVEYENSYTASTGDRYTYRINNIDFGIVERARQDLGLTKKVRTLKITLANGQVVTDLRVEDDGRITGEKQGVTYMEPSDNTEPSNGFIRVELDNEMIQGATLEVGYEFIATNNSELDYLSENFYKYGIVEGEVVKISGTGIIDYLDKDWAFDDTKNSGWETKTLDEVKDLLEGNVYESETSTINDKTILYTNNLKDKLIEPTKSETTTLNVSKILTTAEDISLDNETELVEVDKTGGSDLISTPGNYVPGSGDQESDDGMAETVIITPATGANLSYILPIVIGIVALVIIGTGVVFIKKKALLKKNTKNDEEN